jgi:crotonobetainyl-CoA:carnitine CoA-transferase CaiB-like acyl-CoA transferase
VSLAASARSALVNVAQNVLVTGRDAARWGNAHPNLVPYQAFRAADRQLVIAVGNDAQWIACARALGLEELAADQGLAANAGRVAQRDRVTGALARVLGGREAAHWQGVLDAAGVPNGVVRSVLEAIRDVGASPLDGIPSSVGGSVRRPPPALDEHGALVRARGWSAFAADGL